MRDYLELAAMIAVTLGTTFLAVALLAAAQPH